jgi:hypothetical protein
MTSLKFDFDMCVLILRSPKMLWVPLLGVTNSTLATFVFILPVGKFIMLRRDDNIVIYIYFGWDYLPSNFLICHF